MAKEQYSKGMVCPKCGRTLIGKGKGMGRRERRHMERCKGLKRPGKPPKK